MAVRFGVMVSDPGARDQDVTVASNGPEGKPAGPLVATTAIPVVPTPVVKLTVVDDAVPNVVMDCPAALLDHTVVAKNSKPNDSKYFRMYSPRDDEHIREQTSGLDLLD